MKRLRRFASRLLGSATARRDSRLREELETHLRMQTADNVRAGMTPDEARRQAVLTFGSIEAVKESYRDEQRLPRLDDFVQDVRYAFRQLRRAPLFAFAAILSLAMGIGANAAVFAIVERLLIRSLPVPNPQQLVYVTDERILTQSSPRFSYPFYTGLRQSRAVNGIAARAAVGLNIEVNGQRLRGTGELVSGNYFEVLGATAALGRTLSAADDRAPGAHPVAVISGAFWKRAFSSDAAVLGRSLLLNDQAFVVVGVSAGEFSGTDGGLPADLWIPLAMQREAGRNLLSDARTNWLELIARLRPGVGREQAAEALNREAPFRASGLPPREPANRLVLTTAERGNAPGRAEQRSALLVVFALTALALVLAVVNVASLAAVRAAARDKEMAIRLAIGAGRGRLDRQLLTEGLALATLGGVAALLAVPWTARALMRAYGPPIEIPLADPRIVLFVAIGSLLVGLGLSLVPILASRQNRTIARGTGGGGGRRRRSIGRDLIVVVQIAMALAMLVNASLLLQSLRGFSAVDPGFRVDRLLLITVDPKAAGYEANRIDVFWKAALDRIRPLAGVRSVSLAKTVPLAPGRQRQHWVNPASGESLELDTNFVGPDYFETLRIPVLHGREFGEDDRRASRAVVIVNERLARAYWPDQDAVGQSIRLDDRSGTTAEVVGIARDVKYQDLRGEAGPMVYRPLLQTRSTDAMVLHVSTDADPETLAGPIRSAIQGIDPRVPLFQITTLEQQFDAAFAGIRQAAVLAGVFGALALLLSAVGVYALTAHAVTRRTREIGIRMALGAGRRHIVRALGARITVLIATGLGLGVLGAFAFSAVTATMMYGVSARDLPTLASMTVLIGLLSLLAFVVPLRAATRLKASEAMRHE